MLPLACSVRACLRFDPLPSPPSYYDFQSGIDLEALEVALEREVEGDLFLQDIGQGFGFRPGSFDGAIRCVQYA